MRLLVYSILSVFTVLSCNYTESPERLLTDYIDSNYGQRISDSHFIFVTEYDCLECVQRINKYIDVKTTQNSSCRFYGEYFKTKKYGNSKLENILSSETKVEWKFIRSAKVFEYLSEISGQMSGPYVVFYDESNKGINVYPL